MKNKQVTKYQFKQTLYQPSPLMTEAIRGMIREWAEQDRIKKEGKTSKEVCVSQLMP